ncbi:TolB family protein [Dyella humi]|uniref:PD40 domain-containing protein n=1 Tax=Dyella humi TaxID=1770547 RepID=A0ABW8II28_9GAMM
MLRKPLWFTVALGLYGAACSLFATDMPVDAPQVFAPGVISGPAGEACPAFTPDGNTVYFDVGSMILVSHRERGSWSKPEIAPFSGQWLDHDPTMSPDGSYMVFVSNRPVKAGAEALGATINGTFYPARGGHLWRVDRKGDGWGTPVHLPDAVNASDRTYAPSVAADGSLYFIHPDAQSVFHIYSSAYAHGAYQPAVLVAVGDPAATTHDPAIAPDQSFMVFNSADAKAGSMGDFYIAFREGDHWGKPIDLGEAVNGKPGKWSQWGAHIGPDHRTLYYTSDRQTQLNYPLTPEQAKAALARMQSWDNGTDNIWYVSLAPWLDAHHREG